MASLHDRIEGVLLGTAAGDALGAPYEFQPPRGPELEVVMAGGGPWKAGEWTDDTSMAIAIAEVAATGADLRDEAAQDAIVARWLEWSAGAEGRRHPDPFGAQRSGTPRHLSGACPRRIGEPASAKRPQRRQRLAHADCAAGAGLPRRRGGVGRSRSSDQRTDRTSIPTPAMPASCVRPRSGTRC